MASRFSDLIFGTMNGGSKNKRKTRKNSKIVKRKKTNRTMKRGKGAKTVKSTRNNSQSIKKSNKKYKQNVNHDRYGKKNLNQFILERGEYSY